MRIYLGRDERKLAGLAARNGGSVELTLRERKVTASDNGGPIIGRVRVSELSGRVRAIEDVLDGTSWSSLSAHRGATDRARGPGTKSPFNTNERYTDGAGRTTRELYQLMP